MDIYHFTYRVTNTSNGKYYLGVHTTKCLDDGYLGSGKAIKAAVSKHGLAVFTREILEYFPDRNSAFMAEKSLVTEAVVKDHMSYNLCEGGSGAVGNMIPNTTTRAKMTTAQLNAYASGKRSSNKFMKLGTRSPEIYARIAATKKLRGINPATRSGATHTEITKFAMSQAALNRPKKVCTYCQGLFNAQAMSRYHGSKCKLITTTSTE